MDARIKYLLERYSQDSCTPEEMVELENWYRSLHFDEIPAEWLMNNKGEEEAFSIVQLAQFKERMKERKGNLIAMKHRIFTWRKLVAAASLLVIIGIGLLWYKLHFRGGKPAYVQLLANDEKRINRHLTLPDGTVVILHGNSELDYPQAFNSKSREVTLRGEAYFDVKHNPEKPFIIHTGDIRTVVLGTAFTIEASSSHVRVAVTRGKVRVENKEKVIGMLIQSQEINYNFHEKSILRDTITPDQEIQWIKSDMIFDEMTFQEIAGILSERYGVNIRFEGNGVQNCRAQGSFEGTESLEQVLKILCEVLEASYSIKGKEVVINGNKCQ
jgi:ferric-dicitrate binding protein FerR (iron transport regulator)